MWDVLKKKGFFGYTFLGDGALSYPQVPNLLFLAGKGRKKVENHGFHIISQWVSRPKNECWKMNEEFRFLKTIMFPIFKDL